MLPRAARPAILCALAALALYAVTLAGTYVYDDLYIVQLDPRLDNVSLWGQYWTKDYFNGGADNLYRPLTSMTYALQAKLHGHTDNRAWIYHLINWLLAGAVAAAVAELARRMTQSNTTAILAGLLFAAHPIHVEAIANIVGRAELMCALGMAGALILFLRPLTIARAFAIWACFVFSLLSKEQGMLVPLFILAAIPLRRKIFPDVSDEPRLRARGRQALLLLLVWSLALYIYFRERILKFWWDRSFLDYTINPLVHSHGIDRILMPMVLLGRYVALLLAPIDLVLDYGGSNVIGSHAHLNDPYLYLGFAAVIAWIILFILTLIRRAWTAAFCLFASAALIGMVLNLVTLIGTIFGERLMYIPSIFLCILAGMLLVRLPRRPMIAIATIVLVLFSIRTVSYAWEWNDRGRLFQYSVKELPQSARLEMLLGEEYERRGELDSAAAEMAKARTLEPDYARVWWTSAIIARDEGHLKLAMKYARHAHAIAPSGSTSALISDIAKRMAATQP